MARWLRMTQKILQQYDAVAQAKSKGEQCPSSEMTILIGGKPTIVDVEKTIIVSFTIVRSLVHFIYLIDLII
jgi:hypothetical protein